MHGGSTPRGVQLPQFKTGKFSKHMPTRLGAIYDELSHNGELISIDRNLHLREAFLREGLETLKDAGDPAQAWVDLKKCVDDLNLAIDALSEPLMKKAARKMDEIIDQRYRYHETVKELNKTLTEQRQDIKAKASIELAKEHAVTAGEVMTLIGGIVSIINQIVTDKEQRYAIADGIDKLFGTRQGDTITVESTQA
jgi:ElaB/YqjD/DUF883 family membrane-anchored ribosome-binding protein